MTICPALVFLRKDRTAFVFSLVIEVQGHPVRSHVFPPAALAHIFHSSWIWSFQAPQFTKWWWRDCLSSLPHQHLSDESRRTSSRLPLCARRGAGSSGLRGPCALDRASFGASGLGWLVAVLAVDALHYPFFTLAGRASVAVRVRRTNSASISVAVASYQADLRSKVLGKAPWRAGEQCSEGEHARWPQLPPCTEGRALVLGGANWGGPGGRRQPVSFEKDVWLRGEGERR